MHNRKDISVESVFGMFTSRCRTFCWILLLTVYTQPIGVHGETADNALIAPYEWLLRMYNSTQDIDSTFLEQLTQDFVKHFFCSSEQDGQIKMCQECIRINITNLLTNTSYSTEEILDNSAFLLLHIVSNSNETCDKELTVDQDKINACRYNLRKQFTEDRLGNATSTLDIMAIQIFVENLQLLYYNATDADNVSASGSMQDNKERLIKEKCLGVDILYDELGLDVDGQISVDNVGRLSVAMVYHILNGARVSRDCRLLPRMNFFHQTLFKILGANNGTISKTNLTTVLNRLEIGVTPVSVNTNVTARRRRSLGINEFLYKPTWTNACFTADQLYAVFDIPNTQISMEQFRMLCPALIQQKMLTECSSHVVNSTSTIITPTIAERYGYGSLATFIVCFSSTFGVVFLRFSNDAIFQCAMSTFLGLALGTLFTDAMLHLLPAAFGVHVEGEVHTGDTGEVHVQPFVWFALVTCGGVYALYVFEKIMGLTFGQHAHSHGKGAYIPPKTSESPLSSDTCIELSEKKEEIVENCSVKSTSTNTSSKKALESVVPVVIVGDTIHNFIDGLAIGAAFTSSTTLGVSTSIAVFCHEIPHEFGDFAVLIMGGLSFWKTLMWNIVSSLASLVGLYVGLAVSANDSVLQWILAITAATFIYISLVNVMPQLIEKSNSDIKDFILNNVGILIGAGSMLLMAVYEEKIHL